MTSDSARAIARKIADKYVTPNGRTPRKDAKPKSGYVQVDRQYALSLITEIEADLKARKSAKAKVSLSILRKMFWEPVS